MAENICPALYPRVLGARKALHAQTYPTASVDTSRGRKGTGSADRHHALALGTRMIVPSGVGLAVGYVGAGRNGRRHVWIAAEAATIVLISSVSVGSGLYMGSQRQWLGGGRLAYRTALELFGELARPHRGATVEVGWGPFGDDTGRVDLNGRLGLGVWKNQRTPNVKIPPEARFAASVLLGCSAASCAVTPWTLRYCWPSATRLV